MQNYELTLSSPVATSFRAVKAANSLDIDAEKKSIHHFNVKADIDTPYNIGLIVGASGSGKTTFAKHVWTDECFKQILDLSKPIIEQFPEEMSYDECAGMLCGVGLTSVPCWIRPAYTLSNGQKARAECALQMARKDQEIIVIDEWTSVVDRTVAKVMSHCIQKHARKTNKKIVLLSCHYDVIDWLNPDWVIDANKQEYVNRRLLRQNFQRTERLEFEIREINKDSWRYFSKYHYLSERLPGGIVKTFGLFHKGDQVGFQCYANYVPFRGQGKIQMHSNRTVIHPDYAGLGMGIMLINKTSKIMHERGYDVRAKFSSTPVYLAMSKQREWKLVSVDRKTKVPVGEKMLRKTGFRQDVKTWSFKYNPNA
jgi:energy-coupling factor transporter ATP-binding protein EcfA2